MFRILVLLVSFLPLVLFYSCKQEILPDTKDPIHFHQVALQKICKKMDQCFVGAYRSLPKEFTAQISQRDCSGILEDETLKNHISKLPNEILNYSKTCYEKLIQSDCKRIVSNAFGLPSCSLLRSSLESYWKIK
jgi:hypothetical protein